MSGPFSVAHDRSRTTPCRVILECANATSTEGVRRIAGELASLGIQAYLFRATDDGRLDLDPEEPAMRVHLSLLAQLSGTRVGGLNTALVTRSLFKRALDEWPASLFDAAVVANDGGGPGRFLAAWGRRRRVPVFLVPEWPLGFGLFTAEMFTGAQRLRRFVERWLAPGLLPIDGSGLFAEYVCAAGPRMAQWGASHPGRRHILVTGSPMMEGLVPPVEPSDPQGPAIFIHQPLVASSKPYRGYFEAFCQWAERGPHPAIVKLHPRSSAEERALVEQLAHGGARVVDDRPLEEVMAGAGVAVAGFSTGVTDAIRHGLPLVTLQDALCRGYGLFFHEFDAAAACWSPADVAGVLDAVCADDDRRRHLVQRMRACWDEQVQPVSTPPSSARVAAWIAGTIA